ncbi:MAG: hypothetical protein M3444_10480, partial [Acidobacteriota bacterium]|nr:hypothetical protein [Acidobacteriota bacterium]
MKRLASFLVITLLLSAFAFVTFKGRDLTRTAQAQTPPTQSTQTQSTQTQDNSPTPPPPVQTQAGAREVVVPNPNGSVAAQTGETREVKRTLQCQGCHGPGTTRPYLAGSLFHTDEHAAYDTGFHARAI